MIIELSSNKAILLNFCNDFWPHRFITQGQFISFDWQTRPCASMPIQIKERTFDDDDGPKITFQKGGKFQYSL